MELAFLANNGRTKPETGFLNQVSETRFILQLNYNPRFNAANSSTFCDRPL